MIQDPYELLGVAKNATLKEVRLAYRKAVLKCHPDAFAGEIREGERLFRELTTAYKAILGHLAARKGQSLTPAELATLEMASSLAGIRAAFHRARRKRRKEAPGGDGREGEHDFGDISKAFQTILQRMFRQEGIVHRKGSDPLLPK